MSKTASSEKRKKKAGRKKGQMKENGRVNRNTAQHKGTGVQLINDLSEITY